MCPFTTAHTTLEASSRPMVPGRGQSRRGAPRTPARLTCRGQGGRALRGLRWGPAGRRGVHLPAGLRNTRRRPHLQLQPGRANCVTFPSTPDCQEEGSRGPGGGRGCVEAETTPPQNTPSGAQSPAVLDGGGLGGAVARLAGGGGKGGREAGSPARHFPAASAWAGTGSRLPRPPLPSPPLPARCLRPPASASTLSPSPVCRELGSDPAVARALDVGAGRVHGASARDGQPLHQHCGHRGPEPAERRHPRHAGGGVRVLQFGRTEVIDNTLNPDFVRKFILDYFFEERENLRFDLYDVDSKSPNLSKHDFLGQVFCTLGEIVGSQGSRLEKPIVGIPGRKCGTIILTAEELNCCRDAVLMQFCANKLDKKDFFGKSDPFLVFYRSNEDGSFTICHKTEVVKNTLNPVWQAFKISVRALCNGDYDRTIKVEVYDWDRDGSHDFIGEFTTSYRELSRGQSQFNVYEVVNPKKKGKKKKYTNSGTVTLLSFLVETEVSFLDYIKGGTQINFTVAIDFTASNGNPAQPTSLHYMNPYQLNAYGMALKAVGEIVQDYDSDKMFPALGFGAKLPPDGRISHEFALNGNPQNPYCDGIEGVMEAYYRSLKSVQLYGPTNFAPVINHVARYASSVKDGSQYFVLLIVTDGVISDMAQTKESIVNASKLPMSIIIVGVGPAEFDAMVELDGDDVRVSSRGKYAERDIVQYDSSTTLLV
uniref:Copine 8 n=1 Tax=Canis lupus familiaris TaxID=9615 RepID=A0A8I3S7T1_CANLF